MASAETSSESCKDDGSDEEFSDALFDLKITAAGDDSELGRTLEVTQKAVDMFFRNEFVKAKALMKEEMETSLYHSIGYCTFQYLEAVMTFELKDITDAMNSIKDVLTRFQKCRRKETLGTSIGKALGITNTAELTEEELHAELVFAELYLFRSSLTFIQDENLISFIKGALKVRQCYQMYNSSYKIANKIDWRSDAILQHFAGGVFMGCGAFNVYMSLLPPRIVSLLEWVGFQCDKELGFKQLMDAYEVPNVRSGIASLYVLAYHLFVAMHLGTHDEDLVQSEKILDQMLRRYPDGVYFLLFKGRLESIKGNFDGAISWLEKAASVQQDWKQFAHFCYWELMWCHAFKLEWDKAEKYAEILREESKWSKAIYTYLCAIFLLTKKDRTKEDLEKIEKYMREIPELKQRIAGKSIPMEKFVARKARKYFEQGERLVLPVQEMLYLWTGMAMLAGHAELRKKHIDIINEEKEKLEKLKQEKSCLEKPENSDPAKKSKASKNDPTFNYFDDYCLLQLLKGVCLGYGGQPLQAELCLTDVKENFKGVKKDHYVTPFALVELSWMFIEQQRYDDAKTVLKGVKNDYKHYSHESKLHFRMHAAQMHLNSLLDESAKGKDISAGSKKGSQASLSSNGTKL